MIPHQFQEGGKAPINTYLESVVVGKKCDEFNERQTKVRL